MIHHTTRDPWLFVPALFWDVRRDKTGFGDEVRPGAPCQIGDDQVERAVRGLNQSGSGCQGATAPTVQ